MEELPGTPYLYNLSILAITFSAVSVLVMLIRQTMGGKLSNFDLYLIVTYVSLGFVVAIAAVLPPLLNLFGPAPFALWAIASGLGAVFLAAATANAQTLRHKSSSVGMSWVVKGVFASYWIATLALVVNASVAPVQGVGLHAAAITFYFIVLIVAFVRRIASRLRPNSTAAAEDWEPDRG